MKSVILQAEYLLTYVLIIRLQLYPILLLYHSHFCSVLQFKICQLLQSKSGGFKKQLEQDHACSMSESFDHNLLC